MISRDYHLPADYGSRNFEHLKGAIGYVDTGSGYSSNIVIDIVSIKDCMINHTTHLC